MNQRIDGKSDDGNHGQDGIEDENSELVWEKAKVCLQCWSITKRLAICVNRVPETDKLETWFADAHCPTYAFDGDFTDASVVSGSVVGVHDFAVIVVVA